jgi:hypothetical protein
MFKSYSTHVRTNFTVVSLPDRRSFNSDALVLIKQQAALKVVPFQRRFASVSRGVIYLSSRIALCAGWTAFGCIRSMSELVR